MNISTKKEELTKAQEELTKAETEATKASKAVSNVDAKAKLKAIEKAKLEAAAKAKAKAKTKADAEEKVSKYIAASEEHKKEEDKKKLRKATYDYDQFITDINKKLDHIIFLCNQFDFERINMLLKKLIVNHDYVAKNIIPNARKYSDLSSNKELNDKMLEKGGYTKMIVSMDKNFILINKKFTKFWEEYSGKIKTFHEESMSDDIKEINSKIAEILKKLKKLRYDDGKEQSTVPFDFSLIADNAIIYNFYNFFKKIIKKLHIIEGSIPDDANYEEFIAEQRREFDRKFYRMYESLYTDFKEKLDASLKKIEIIKDQPKNNLSAIINILEQSVINNPENIAKAMSYLYTEIPEEEVPYENESEPIALIAKEEFTINELKTKKEDVEKLESDIKQIEVDLLILKSKSTEDETEELNELEKKALDATLLTDLINGDTNVRLNLMGIPGVNNNDIIESQKKWINTIQIQDGDNDEVIETLRYIMMAERNQNTIIQSAQDDKNLKQDYIKIAEDKNKEMLDSTKQQSHATQSLQHRKFTSQAQNLLKAPVAPVAQETSQLPVPVTEQPVDAAAPANITKHFKYSFEKTKEITNIYENKGYKYENGTNDGASFMASLNAGHRNLRVGGGTINVAFRNRIEPGFSVYVQDTPFQNLSVNLHISCYMYYHYGTDVRFTSKSAEIKKMNITDKSTDGSKSQNTQSGFIKFVEDINSLPGDDNLLYKFENLPGNSFIKEMYLYIPKERLDKLLKFPTTSIIPGDIFIDILQDIPSLNGDTDTANNANRAMIYCAGPEGDNIKLNNPNAKDDEIKDIFLKAIEQVGKNIANAIFLYNKNKNLEKEKIDYVRICLISGNQYLPDAMNRRGITLESQKQVAMKLIDGIHSANMDNDNDIKDNIVYNFAYADKAFLNAYNEQEIKDKISPYELIIPPIP